MLGFCEVQQKILEQVKQGQVRDCNQHNGGIFLDQWKILSSGDLFSESTLGSKKHNSQRAITFQAKSLLGHLIQRSPFRNHKAFYF